MRRNPDVCAYGASAVLAHLEKLMSHMENAKEMEDPEDVHQLRVTSRRLRATLPVFRDCFQGELYKDSIRRIKGVTRSLGSARDLDVQILFLEGIRKGNSRRRIADGIRFLLDEKRRSREAVQPDVVASMEKLASSNVPEELASECRRMVGEGGGPETPSAILYHMARDNLVDAYGELRSLSVSLEDASDRSGHHSMRIAAKHLRYTLELFSDLYEDRLSGQISFLKHLQDILGELHDADVWLDHVPAAREAALKASNTLAARGLDLFGDHMVSVRAGLFEGAVSLWNSEERTSAMSFLETAEHVDAVLPASAFPKVAVISDVHGNLQALRAVMEDAAGRGAHLFLNAGDLVGFGASPHEVVQELSSDRFLSISGNFDRELLDHPRGSRKSAAEEEKRSSLKHSRDALGASSLRFLADLPRTRSLMIGRTRLHMVHTSPLSKKEQVTLETPLERLESMLATAGAELLVVGHSHQQFLRQAGQGWVLNPGSVGRPSGGDPRASYAIIDAASGSAELIKVDYDIDSAVETIRKEKLPEHFAQMLIRGRSLESVMEEEALLDNLGRSAEDLDAAREKVRAASLEVDPDPSHTEKVRALSLVLFDRLSSIHNLGNDERHMLECAALLHDIGWNRSGKHHKNSMEMVLNDQSLPFSVRERYMVGSIARYHNSLPRTKHYNYAVLKHVDRRCVSMLSSVLRIADSLDASHGGKVSDITVEIGEESVTISGTSDGVFTREMESFTETKDLCERVFRRRIDLHLRRRRSSRKGSTSKASPRSRRRSSPGS